METVSNEKRKMVVLNLGFYGDFAPNIDREKLLEYLDVNDCFKYVGGWKWCNDNLKYYLTACGMDDEKYRAMAITSPIENRLCLCIKIENIN